MEVFRCGCEKGFELELEGREKTAECPNCNARWKVEPKRGYYRIYEWVD